MVHALMHGDTRGVPQHVELSVGKTIVESSWMQYPRLGSRVVLSRMLCRFLPCAYQCICVHYSALGVHFASAPPKYHASTRLFVAFLCVAYPCMLILCCIFIEFPWAAFLCISLVAFVSMRCYFVLRRIRQHSHPVYTTCIWTHMHCIS